MNVKGFGRSRNGLIQIRSTGAEGKYVKAHSEYAVSWFRLEPTDLQNACLELYRYINLLGTLLRFARHN
jgi:hypothetical protein